MVTPEVVDILESEIGESQGTPHTVSAMCTSENLVTYRLDPPRNGTQCALLTITGMTNNTFIVETVQLLTREEAREVKASLRAVLDLATRLYGRDRKRGVEEPDAFALNPAVTKCSRLGLSPTDTPLLDPDTCEI